MEKRFKLVKVMMGSGWPSGHVAINFYHTWPDKAGGGEMCLNFDTVSAEELSNEIDQLIAELEEIRAEAPKHFKRWTVQYNKKLNKGG